MAESKRDYYEVLGIPKTATEAEIKKAFRTTAKKYHPDMHPGDKECEEKFKEAQEAYAVLSDPEKRRQYDQFGHAAFDGGAGGAVDGSQIMQMLREDPEFHHIPIIFLTGKNDAETVKNVMSLKPDGYLLKSMNPQKLHAAIDDFFASRGK